MFSYTTSNEYFANVEITFRIGKVLSITYFVEVSLSVNDCMFYKVLKAMLSKKKQLSYFFLFF